jgi:hypothetical protein
MARFFNLVLAIRCIWMGLLLIFAKVSFAG